MNKILIIGSEGFIGSHLYALLQESYDVLGCDIIDSAKKNFFRIHNLEKDLITVIRRCSHDDNLSCIINCSGSASVPLSMKEPGKDFELNTYNISRILTVIKECDSKVKFLNLSSAAVYGNPIDLPISEEMNPLPLSPYGYHKLMSEMICKEYNRIWGIPTLSARIFSAYGEGLKKQIFYDLYSKTIGNDNVQLFGSGKESRDFIHISDLVRALQLIIENAFFDGGVINVASGNESFIEDIVAPYFELLSYKGNYEFIGRVREGDPINWKADISKLRDLGFAPTVNIIKGLGMYSEWVINNG